MIWVDDLKRVYVLIKFNWWFIVNEFEDLSWWFIVKVLNLMIWVDDLWLLIVSLMICINVICYFCVYDLWLMSLMI